MVFKVVNYIQEKDPRILYLVEDVWDDWFTYSTLYQLKYFDEDGKTNHIGGVKIGQRNQKSRRPQIPQEFETLSKEFFSIGNSEYYYQELSGLGNEIREKILVALNDIARNLDLLLEIQNEMVAKVSLLRDKTLSTIKGQYNRMANGGARLTNYNFLYTFSNSSVKIKFDIQPESFPPTNIHVLIGKNGVGKTTLLKNMLEALQTNNIEESGKFELLWAASNFANVVFVSFSIFDEYINCEYSKIPYLNIGITKSDGRIKDKNDLGEEFARSLYVITRGEKKKLWNDAVSLLESDNTFTDLDVKDWSSIEYNKINYKELEHKNPFMEVEDLLQLREARDMKNFAEVIKPRFKLLSSGHKVILLTIAKLVETVEEKTLVLLDEPEEHLHPPLVSAFIRALSNLLIYRNGVGIIATHSPVIVQEVPRRCVSILRRSGNEIVADRPQIETFGENLGILTSEIFGFEVTNSGFHKMINDVVHKHSNFDAALKAFNGEVGEEGRTMLRCFMYENELNGENDD